MRTLTLTSLTHIPGQRIWAITRFEAQPELIVTEIPDHLPQWEVTNRAMEAEFSVLRRGGPVRYDVQEGEARGTPSVTYQQLLQAKAGGPFTIMLNPKMGRPPKDGQTERVEIRMSGEERYIFEAMGGGAWLREQIAAERGKREQADRDRWTAALQRCSDSTA